MRPILSEEGQPALVRFARRNTLLALDYDGTLAPIVADPARTRMRERTHDLLSRISRRYPTVVISGRSRLDVLRLLAGIQPAEVIGNHGLEADGVRGIRFSRRVQRWQSLLARPVASLPGAFIENKGASLTVHYRNCDNPTAAREAILDVASGLDAVRIIGGKQALNLVPQEAPHKGAALLSLCARLECRYAIYVGDDDTDEDVFKLDRPGELLSIRVERRDDSAATYYLRDQLEVDDLLETLLVRVQSAAGV
ncbi:MAG: trehalose-phosphatase [Nevskiales bacterium]